MEASSCADGGFATTIEVPRVLAAARSAVASALGELGELAPALARLGARKSVPSAEMCAVCAAISRFRDGFVLARPVA